MKIAVGIYVHAEPDRLQATLAVLRANTNRDFDLLLLADGPDPLTAAALARLPEIPQSTTADARGTPACFNRLLRWTDADRIVLLESGCLPGPGWLDYLMQALDADERNGLAGPSTNLCWNEQGVFPRVNASSQAVAAAARLASERYSTEVRGLEPLYSLADFCYAVRRDVANFIGIADESYGLGPCWEMDYNIRAARAGFRGVWACGAYVHRSPYTARRRREEAMRFEASRRRYQDKFCGLRLRGESTGYEPHCRGEECEHFAPRDLVRVFEGGAAQLPIPEIVPARALSTDRPLVTCIMPTRNRRSFVPQAIEYFRRQDYPETELLILDDGDDPVGDCIGTDQRIRYLRLPNVLPIGAKRNLACEEARGAVIVHWDDDDWYPRTRITRQVAALSERSADICGSSQLYYYDADADRAWVYRYNGRPSPWVAGNTLAYWKSFWQSNRFPEVQVGEDSRFLLTKTSKTVCDLNDPAMCVGLVHKSNASAKETHGAWWHVEPVTRIHSLLGSDLPFYRRGCAPMISCIMPTSGRRSFLPLTLELFRAQDYANKELIVVDDGVDPIGALVNDLPDVRYVKLENRTTIGAKRNLACQHAHGEIIVHWDDDDWYGPARLRLQADPILRGEADLTALTNSFVLDALQATVWTLSADLHKRMFIGDVHGGTLAFRKDLFDSGLRYPEVDLAEDATLIRRAMLRGKRLLKLDNPGVFVYVRHGRNAWRFQTGEYLDARGWSRIDPPAAFSHAVLEAYCTAARLQ